MRRGSTLFELGVVLALIGLCAGMAMPRFTGYRDRIATEAAAASVIAALSTARYAALRNGVVTAIRFDTVAARLVVHTVTDTLLVRDLTAAHGARLAASRDSIAYAGNGMGYGAANTQLVVGRGAAAETLVVSRLGRVRR